MKKKTIIITIMLIISSIIPLTINMEMYARDSNLKEQPVFSYTQSNSAVATDPNSWPMFGHDPAHTGYSTSTAPETNQTIIEKVSPSMNTLGGISISKGRAYVTTTFGANFPLYVVDVYTGEILNTKNFTGATMSTSPVPAIDDKNIYLGAAKEDGFGAVIYGLNATTLNKKWSYDPGTGRGYLFGSPTLVDDKIYIAGSHEKDGRLWCITTQGVFQWNFVMGNYKSCSPAVADGKVYFSSNNSKIYCLDAATGAYLWNFSEGGPILTSSVVVMNGKVYYGSTDDYLYILDANTGNFIKKVPLGGDPTTAAAHNDKLYIGSTNGKFYCLNATGDELWSFTATGAIKSTPAIADGKVYFGDDGTTAFCLNAETGSKIWEKYADSPNIFSRGFVVYDGNVYTVAGKKVFGFGSETGGPATPEKPSGPTSGFVGEVYQYTTSTTDPDGDQIWYQWSSESAKSWIGPFDSGAQAQASYTWTSPGVYQVKVKAKDSSGAESDWSEPLIITITASKSPLAIAVPSSVIEGNDFQVTVTADNAPIKDAQITFDSQTTYTESDGKVTLTAPHVDQTTPYLITASKDDYTSAMYTIIVLHQNPESTNGFIYGVISDTSGTPISGAQIGVRLSEGETRYASSDTIGRYMISIPPGTYTVVMSKAGYITTTIANVIVVAKNAIEQNCALETAGTPPISSRRGAAEYLIQEKIQEGKVGIQMEISHPNKNPTISYYADELTIDVISVKDMVSFTVSAPNGTNATILVIHIIGTEVLSDLDNLNVTYDRTPIDEETDAIVFFNPQNSTTPSWLRFSTTTGIYLCFRVPHFSEHTITIHSWTELGSIILIMLYIAIGTIATILFVAPTMVRYLRRRYFQKRLL